MVWAASKCRHGTAAGEQNSVQLQRIARRLEPANPGCCERQRCLDLFPSGPQIIAASAHTLCSVALLDQAAIVSCLWSMSPMLAKIRQTLSGIHLRDWGRMESERPFERLDTAATFERGPIRGYRAAKGGVIQTATAVGCRHPSDGMVNTVFFHTLVIGSSCLAASEPAQTCTGTRWTCLAGRKR